MSELEEKKTNDHNSEELKQQEDDNKESESTQTSNEDISGEKEQDDTIQETVISEAETEDSNQEEAIVKKDIAEDVQVKDIPEKNAQEQKQPASKTETSDLKGVQININANASEESLVTRTEMFVEEGNWEYALAYADYILDMNPKNGDVYYLKILVNRRAKTDEELIEIGKPLDSDPNYKYIKKYGTLELQERIQNIEDKIFGNNCNQTYTKGLAFMQEDTVNSLKNAIDKFNEIKTWKDSEEQIQNCEKRIKEIQYTQACELMEKNDIESFAKAVYLLKQNPDWENSEELIQKCDQSIQAIKDDVIKAAKDKIENSDKKESDEGIKELENLMRINQKYKLFDDDLESYINEKKSYFEELEKQEEKKKKSKKIKMFSMAGAAILALILLVFGISEANKDPFIGSWKSEKGGTYLLINEDKTAELMFVGISKFDLSWTKKDDKVVLKAPKNDDTVMNLEKGENGKLLMYSPNSKSNDDSIVLIRGDESEVKKQLATIDTSVSKSEAIDLAKDFCKVYYIYNGDFNSIGSSRRDDYSIRMDFATEYCDEYDDCYVVTLKGRYTLYDEYGDIYGTYLRNFEGKITISKTKYTKTANKDQILDYDMD